MKPMMPPLNGGFKEYPSPGFAQFGQQSMPPMQQNGQYPPFDQSQQPFSQGGFVSPPFPPQSAAPQQANKPYDSALDIGNIREDQVDENQMQSVGTAEFKEATLPKPTQQNNQNNSQNQQQKNNQNKGEKPAQDWLKPQIFNNQQDVYKRQRRDSS